MGDEGDRDREPRPSGGLRAWTTFFRTRLLPTPWLNATTGAIACGALFAPPALVDAALGFFALTALYCFGMGLNDWCDRERDRTIAPTRPLPSGAIDPARALFALATCLAVATLAVALLPLRCAPWGAAILATILLYDALLKDHAWLGPLAMGSVRSAVVLFGGSLVGEVDPATIPALIIGGHGFWVTRYSMEEERARPAVLAGRARAISAHSLAAFFITATFLETSWWWHLGWVPLLVFWGALEPSRRLHPPGWFTFRSLRALLLLDGALQLSYNSPFSALLCLLAFLWTGRAPRSSGATGPRE